MCSDLNEEKHLSDLVPVYNHVHDLLRNGIKMYYWVYVNYLDPCIVFPWFNRASFLFYKCL